MRRITFHDQEHQNHERWLLTYADMITLLTAFFLMLYSMSVMSRGKFSALATSLRGGFRGVLTESKGNGIVGPTAANSAAQKYQQYQSAMADLRKYVEQQGKSDQVTLRGDERGVVISLVADGVLFDQGAASLKPASHPLLDKVAQTLKVAPNAVQVEGHTDDLPIHTSQFPSNWELSTARAGAVLRAFLSSERLSEGVGNASAGANGLGARRFTCAGYADTRPLVSNDTDAHRAQNRRVEIILLKTEAQRDGAAARRQEMKRVLQDASDPPAAAN